MEGKSEQACSLETGDLCGLPTRQAQITTLLPPTHKGWGSLCSKGIQPFALLFLPQNLMEFLAFLSLLTLVLQEAEAASLPRERQREEQSQEEGDTHTSLHVGSYYALSLEDYSEVIDLSSYEEPADYGDQMPEVR